MPARIITLLVLFLFSVSAAAQETAPQAEPVPAVIRTRVDQFFDGVSRGQVQEAYDTLLAGSALAQQAESLSGLVARTEELELRYGRFIAAEGVQARMIGRDLAVLKYLYKCEQFPVVWTLVFYRPRPAADTAPRDDQWRVISVRFDTEVEALARAGE